jgi:sulfatase modifying factor 1
MTLTINVPDTLRRAVESASSGRNTVLYTAKGQPCHMVVIPRVTLQSIDASLGTGDHPAFIVGGVSKSEIFLGQHIGCSRNAEMLSLPGVGPISGINHDSAVSLARANGPGWHLMSNTEWALMALLCWRAGTQPRGNTNFGRSSDLPSERGVDSATGRLALATGSATTQTLTGSGPASWRHDYTPFGMADLSGNVWEWSPGMRLMNSEIQVILNNDSALSATDLGASSTAWRAVDGATGALVAPGLPGTVKYVSSNGGSADFTLYRTSGQSFEGMANSAGANPVSAASLALLRSLGLFPVASNGLGGDGFFLNPAGERLPIRGGYWYSGGAAGVSALTLNDVRSNARPDLGARPAFVL